MNTPQEPTHAYYTNYGGQQVNAGRIDAVYYTERERVRVNAFTQEDIERLKIQYVPTPALGSAVAALNARSAVALVGPAGCGRRVTGGAALIEVGATPHYPIYLDPADDRRRDLPVDQGCGYLIDIDDEAVHELDGLRDLIAAYRERLSTGGAYLVVIATPTAWGTLGQQTGLTTVIPQRPDPVEVFRSHLRYERPTKADETATRPDVIKVLTDTRPADAVRLAQLVSTALSAGTNAGMDPIQEAISAYRNWSNELSAWFMANGAGYQRALLIAAATLNGVDAAAVFVAADRLSARVGLPRPPGGGLVGDGVDKLIGDIGADLTNDGRILLPRPAYPASVLDHVWQYRPQLRADLKAWLIGLPESLDANQARGVGDTLIDLAVRQADAPLITNAVNSWATPKQVYRDLAVATLTKAAVDDGIGRAVRRTMYRWATNASTDENLQVTIADVCGGLFGRTFPSNALTRLRHLALRGSDTVREHVTKSLRELAATPELRDFMLREIVAWSGMGTRARGPAMNAFLALALEDTANLIPRTTSDSDRIELLAAGLRATLRDPDHVLKAREACCVWLEAVALGQLRLDVVTDTIAHTCADSCDIGALVAVVWQWGRTNSQETPQASRQEIAAVMVQKAVDRDPLAPGVPAAIMPYPNSEGGL